MLMQRYQIMRLPCRGLKAWLPILRSSVIIPSWKSTHDRVAASQANETGLPEYIGREVALMTAYEIISIFIEILALLMSFGSLIVALLAFLDRDRKNRRKK